MSYTPKHLAEKILASRAGLEGERKQVTVLFADVVGSTELIRDRDPEEAQRLLDGVVRVMMDAVHRYEGTVSRLTGDGLMALFGAPIAHEDHAVRACYAALAMLDRVRSHGEAARRDYGTMPTIRVGLSAGEVVVRAIRDDLHMDYTAMGQTVHLASRMEQLAAPGSAALTAETVALVEGYVQVRSLGRLPIKGLPEPMEAFELAGPGQARTRLQVAAGRGLTRFVGRDAEMDALYAALKRAGSGRGQVAALVGEPGVGKSRIVWELTHSHRTQGWLVLESGSVSYGKATSYLPVIDLLKAYCRIESRDDERAIREKVTGKLLTLDESLRPVQPSLFSLLDVPVDDPAWDDLDPAQRRRQTLDAIKHLLLRESREQALLLVFEDLHWIDAETQALLDGLVEALPTARILLLVNYRPEYAHGWGSKGCYTQLRIDPLADVSADELLAALLGHDATLDPLKALLVARTEGNPFFLEESVRSLVEAGVLAGERGGYRLAGPVESIRVPATVQAVLAARIDRLPSDEKRLLQAAAVIGKDVPDALLRAVAEGDEDGLRRRLAGLQAAELLYEASLFPEPEYTFKHALTHDVAYGSLLQERRKTLHARIVAAVQTVYADRLVEQTELLAHHAVRGEVWEQALSSCREAGLRAIARSANHEGVEWLGRALDALDRMPPDRAAMEQAVDLRLDLGTALRPSGESQRSLARLREAEAIAERLGDRRRRGRVACQIAYGLMTTGERQAGIELGLRALEIGRAIGDAGITAVAGHRLAQAYGHLGQFRRATDLLRETIAALDGELFGSRLDMAAFPAVESRTVLAQCLAELGGGAEAVQIAREAIEIAERLGHQFTLMIANIGAAPVFHLMGDIPAMVAAIERADELNERWGFPGYANWLASHLGWASMRTGRTADGLRRLDEGAARDAVQQNQAARARLATTRGEGYLLGGRAAEARREAGLALSLAQARGERGYEARALQLLGEIAASDETPEAGESETRYRQALALAEELGMCPLQAHCHLGLGRLYRRTGRTDEARAELATATAMLREMGMMFWLPEAERELAGASR